MRQALLEVGVGAGLPEAPVGLGEEYLGSMCSVSRSALVLPAPGVCSLGTVPRVCLHPSWVSPGSPAPLTPAVVLALSAPCPRAAVAEPTQRLSVPRGLAVFRSFAGRDSPGVMACVLSVAQGQQVGLGLMGLIEP